MLADVFEISLSCDSSDAWRVVLTTVACWRRGGVKGGGEEWGQLCTSGGASRAFMPWRAKVSTPRQAVATTARPAAMASSTGMPQASYRLLNRNASCPQYSSGNTSCTQAHTLHVTSHASLLFTCKPAHTCNPAVFCKPAVTCTSVTHHQRETTPDCWRQQNFKLSSNKHQ